MKQMLMFFVAGIITITSSTSYALQQWHLEEDGAETGFSNFFYAILGFGLLFYITFNVFCKYKKTGPIICFFLFGFLTYFASTAISPNYFAVLYFIGMTFFSAYTFFIPIEQQ